MDIEQVGFLATQNSQYLVSFIMMVLTTGYFSLPGQALEHYSFDILAAQLIEHKESSTEIDQGFQEGNRLFHVSRFQEALIIYQQALALRDESNSSSLMMGNLLHNAAVTARILGQLDFAQTHIDQAIIIAQNLNNLDLLSRSINEAGVIAYNLSQFELALEHYQQALEISRKIGTQTVETHILDNMGVVYRRQGKYNTALEFHQQSLTLSKSISDHAIQANILNNIGVVYDLYGDYEQSLEFQIQALAIGQENSDRLVESRILNSIGFTHLKLGDYTQAQFFLQKALTISKTLNNKVELGSILNNIGLLLRWRGEYDQSIATLKQALNINQTIGNQIDKAVSLTNIGLVYWHLGDYKTALKYCQEALEIQKNIGDYPGEAYTLASIGSVYFSTSNYTQSLQFFEQSLKITQEIGARSSEGVAANSIGGVYYILGQLDQALEYYQQALTIRREIGDRRGVAITLNNIALVFKLQENLSEALATFQQALVIRREIGNRLGEARTLNNIGSLYIDLEDYPAAIDATEQSLTIYRDIGNLIGEANSLTTLGVNYQFLEQNEQALQTFQVALSVFQELGNREGERFVLSSIGNLLVSQEEIELAIVFYKKSVNLTESIRQEIQDLPSDVQQSYTDTVAFTYRRLADLLLQENRVLEAQRVLDLLKVQELDEYLRGFQRNADTASGILLREEEEKLFERFQANQTNLIALSRELWDLEKISPVDRTSAQVEQVRELRQLQQKARQNFRGFFESEEIQALVTQLRQTTGAASLELRELNALQDNLQTLEQNAVILYPLVLEDRIELILVTATSPPIRRTVSVSRVNLNGAIANFRSALQDPGQQVIPLAQQLYSWLIRPLEAELNQVDADIIIYAPDGQLRYIPLAALHDGNQWLVERFQVNNITAASLDDLDKQPTQENLNILAAAFTEGQHEVQISDRTLVFGGLEFAGREVENLAQLISNTDKRLDAEFNTNIVYDMNDFNVVHLATHAAFNPGPPEDSFILFGDGSRATLTDIKDWNFPNVELIVLSACETALGDISLGNGEEILGFGYLMQLAGADAAITSLWQVDDGGTQTLMNAFYVALQNGYSKAKSLQRAQQSLITGDVTLLEHSSRGIDVVSIERKPQSSQDSLRHPYYWAPFILIGNGL